MPTQNAAHRPGDLNAEASLRYVVDTLRDLRLVIPPQAGPVLPHLLDLMCLEASEVSIELASLRMRTMLLGQPANDASLRTRAAKLAKPVRPLVASFKA